MKQFNVLVEIPKNSSIKYEYDKTTGRIKVDRFLYGTNVMPGDYGFIPETLELDSDPVDVLILTFQPTFPGCVVPVRIIGGLDLIDDGEQDRKLIAVPAGDPAQFHVHNLNQISEHQKAKIIDFFANYKNLEHKKIQIKGWVDLEASLKIIEECQKRFQLEK